MFCPDDPFAEMVRVSGVEVPSRSDWIPKSGAHVRLEAASKQAYHSSLESCETLMFFLGMKAD